ncbi:hypothetical protein [Chitinophaga sp. ARDCPP14]|uniref:hypothetical protein n=1 Tax=Chitinophaga sp. ARDCPP14 TaxID=3391139 RepID=UPI003F52886C
MGFHTAMINYLQKEDQQAAQFAKKAISCFEPFNQNEQQYATRSTDIIAGTKVYCSMMEFDNNSWNTDQLAGSGPAIMCLHFIKTL